jgi:group I intron endonuclease
MSYGIIYKATGPTGKVYIGQTKLTLKRRKAGHKFMALKGDRRFAFQIALLDEGFDNFAWEQIDQADTPEELDRKEKEWIAYYKADDPACGYNILNGGKHFTTPPETRRKISEARKGIVFSPETLQRMSKAQKGKKHGPRSLETRQKLSRALKGKQRPDIKGKHLSEEHRRKIGEANRENLKRLWADPEYQKHMIEAHTGKGKIPICKLTEEAVRDIRIGLANGKSARYLAKKYSVNHSRILDVKNGKTYVWVLDVSADMVKA